MLSILWPVSPLQYYRGQARYRVGQTTTLSADKELPPITKKQSVSYIPVFSNAAKTNMVNWWEGVFIEIVQILHHKYYIPNITSQILHHKYYITNITSQILNQELTYYIPNITSQILHHT